MTETTVAALLDAAEAAFATHGIERASLRAVMRDAAVDPGAVHYHFGGRAELAEAVLDHVLVPLNDRRIELLEAARAAAAPAPIAARSLIEALVRPDIEAATALNGRGPDRARLIGVIYLDPARFVTELVERRFAPVAQRFFPHVMAAGGDLDPDTLSWRIRWFVFGPVGAVLGDPAHAPLTDPDGLLRRLVDAATAAVFAPTPP